MEAALRMNAIVNVSEGHFDIVINGGTMEITKNQNVEEFGTVAAWLENAKTQGLIILINHKSADFNSIETNIAEHLVDNQLLDSLEYLHQCVASKERIMKLLMRVAKYKNIKLCIAHGERKIQEIKTFWDIYKVSLMPLVKFQIVNLPTNKAYYDINGFLDLLEEEIIAEEKFSLIFRAIFRAAAIIMGIAVFALVANMMKK